MPTTINQGSSSPRNKPRGRAPKGANGSPKVWDGYTWIEQVDLAPTTREQNTDDGGIVGVEDGGSERSEVDGGHGGDNEISGELDGNCVQEEGEEEEVEVVVVVEEAEEEEDSESEGNGNAFWLPPPSQVISSGSVASSAMNLTPDQKRAALITGQHVLEYKTWFQVVCGMRNSTCTYEDAVGLTRRYLEASGKHPSDKEGPNKIPRLDTLRAEWNASMAQSKATIGTVVHHAKLCNQAALSALWKQEKAVKKAENPKQVKAKKEVAKEVRASDTAPDKPNYTAVREEFESIESEEPEWSDFGCADTYLSEREDTLVYQSRILYVYDSDRVRWKEDADGIIVQNEVNIHLRRAGEVMLDSWEALYSKVSPYVEEDDRESALSHLLRAVQKKLNEWKGNIARISSVAKTKSVYKAILSRLAQRGDAVEFDEQRDLFAWDNCVFDVRTGQCVTPKKEDYILTTNRQQWREPTDEEMATVASLFKSTFPNETHRRSYESVLWSGLTGHRKEKFIIAQGEGRNGKGMLNEFMLSLLNDYGAVLHLGLLTQPIKVGPNTELRSLHKKRFVLASEPEDHASERLKANNIKALTGNECHKARACHSNDDDTRIHMTLTMECNDLPFIQGGTGEAMTARVIIVPFLVTFTNDPMKLAMNHTKYKPMVEAYKAHDFKRQHAPALFKYLCSHGYSDLIITDESRQLGFKYLCSKDELTAWFDTYYEKDKGDMVAVKEIFTKLKRTTFYTEMDKKEKRLYTYNSFVTNLQKSLALGKFLLEPDQYHNGKRVKGYTMRGWRERPGMMDDDERHW